MPFLTKGQLTSCEIWPIVRIYGWAFAPGETHQALDINFTWIHWNHSCQVSETMSRCTHTKLNCPPPENPGQQLKVPWRRRLPGWRWDRLEFYLPPTRPSWAQPWWPRWRKCSSWPPTSGHWRVWFIHTGGTIKYTHGVNYNDSKNQILHYF